MNEQELQIRLALIRARGSARSVRIDDNGRRARAIRLQRLVGRPSISVPTTAANHLQIQRLLQVRRQTR
jgi:hypothetical protein